MSIIIRGMKMPRNCTRCPCSDEEARFCWAKAEYIPMLGKPDWCPLVELPKKHGRLIDADELWKKMSKYTDNEGAKFPYGDDDSMIHRDSACFMIENADTIIEAEGWEE